MEKLEWCKKKGLRFIEPSKIIAKDYFRKADEALKLTTETESREWKAISSYYACYDALYALLQIAGIKSGIHECTIELMSFFGFSEETKEFMFYLKKQRENAQYYVNRPFSLADSAHIKKFVLSCKERLEELDFEDVKNRIIARLGIKKG